MVSATRGEATLSSLGVAADVIDRQRIDDRAAPSLLPLLQEVPGVSTARTGQTGLQASVFVRGGESRYARVLVDGVPVNQPGGAFDFGTAVPFELERVEVVRGAASSLYGTDALAGVISLQTRRARPGESPSLRAEGEGGSFDWQRFLGATSGARGAFDWNAGVQRLKTDNEEPNSRFEQTAAALSAGARIDSRTDARAVVRFDDSTTGTPGPTAFGRPDLDASFEREDLVVSASVRRAEARLAQQLNVGYARTDQLSRNPEDSGCYVPEWEGQAGAFPICDFPNEAGFQNQTSRLAAGYQADVSLGTRHLLTTGAEVEHETGALGNRAEELLHAGAHELRRLPAGPRAARRARVPDAWAGASRETAATARTPCRGPPSPCACATATTPRPCGRAPAWGSRSRASSSRTASPSSRRATPTSTPSAARPSTSGSSSVSSGAGCGRR